MNRFLQSRYPETRRNFLKATALAMTGAAVAGCSYLTSWDWRQKMTVTVGTSSGPVSASAVTSVKWWKNFFSGAGFCECQEQ